MKLKETYSGQEKLFEYLDEYKYPKRHQFVKAFTSKHTHLGHIATSRGEQGHYHFKQFLHGNRHDLLDLKDKWEVMIGVDQVNHAKDLAHQRSRPSHEIQAKRWSEWVEPDLNNFITPAGMELLVKQLYLARDVTVDGHCSGSFTTIHNIPCYHHIRLLKQFNRKVTRHDFHKHWHFVRPVNTPQDGEATELPPSSPPPSRPNIFAPHVVRTRGRPRRDHSTRRNPSAFELTAGTQARRPGRLGGESFSVKPFSF